MAFRVVFVESETQMKTKLENLVVTKGTDDIWIPLDDISMIVIDNLCSSLTVRTMCEFANHNIGVLFCNHEHLPIGFFSSYENHSRVSKMIGYQINKESLFLDKLWKQIVEQKILNQADALIRLGKSSESVEKMKRYAAEVEIGDATNREAHAAKVYFNTLMGKTFSRGNEDILLNSGLDYGYSIIRSYIARLCGGYGLNCQLGIHHKNEFNRFNLVDDLLEPIRPFVDCYAYSLLKDEEYFKPEHRHSLVNILNHKTYYKGKNMYLGNALEDYVEQIASLLAEKTDMVIFPRTVDYMGEEKDEI